MAVELDPLGIGSVNISMGGTGANTAGQALSNLGGQPADSDLTIISSGTFAQKRALIEASAKHVPGVANLRLTSADFSGDNRYLTYHTSLNDGGHGLFVWDAASTVSDNNGTIIQVTGVATGRWIRQLSGFIIPGMFGAACNGSSNDSIQINQTFDCAISNNMVVKGAGRWYTCNTALRFVSDDDTTARHDKRVIFDGEGCTFDFSGGVWAADYTADEQIDLFTVGTESNTTTPSDPKCIVENGLFSITNFKIIGNEVRSPTTPDATVPITGTVGLRLSLAQNVELRNVTAEACTVGFETKDSWGIKGTNLQATFCWIGYCINGGSTYATWEMCQTTACAYDRILRSSTKAAAPFYGAFASVQNQTFINHRAENCWYPIILYPHDTNIYNTSIIGGAYSEDVEYDYMVAGYVFNQQYIAAPSSTLSLATVLYVDGLTINTGKMQFGRTSGYLIRGPKTTSTRIKNASINVRGTISDIDAGFKNSMLRVMGDDSTPVAYTRYYSSSAVKTIGFEEETGIVTIGELGAGVMSGVGNPGGIITAPVGRMYINTSGAAGEVLWIKESGTGTTGWVEK